MKRLNWFFVRWLYRRHLSLGHTDSHDGCRDCNEYVEKLRKLDLATARLLKRVALDKSC